jgi:hypothetical protein
VKRAILPEPDLGDLQPIVDVELVEKRARVNDLEGDVRDLSVSHLRADPTALVGLDPPLLGFASERRRAVTHERQAPEKGVELD